MEHDQLFKELLTVFLREFVELFFPKLAEFLDSEFSLIPMSQEILGDVEIGERHVVDLLMRSRFKGQDAYFLIHVENQATKQSDFSQRMFGDFSRLHLKYKLPVYPIVVFSYDTPKSAEPARYVVTFPHKTVMRFDYEVVQLNRMPWRRFLKSKTPVAPALMAKMNIPVKDRPKARAELLRVLASRKLDPARTHLLGVFIDRYLKLTEAEMQVFERAMAGFAPAEWQETMEMVSSWELVGEERGVKRGLEQGLHEGKQTGLHDGKAEMAMRLIRKRFGIASSDVSSRLLQLSAAQLDDLGEALFDFTSLADLEQWLARR